MRTSLRRTALWAATPALVVSTLVVTAPPATADSPALSNAPVAGAAHWLAGQLTDGLLVNDQYDFTDVGLSVDLALGLAAVGDDGGVATVAEAVLAPDTLAGYIGDGTTQASAGATAKALLLAQAAGVDPADAGGVDLVSRLESLVLTDGDVAGRIQDRSAWGDYANVIGQSYAVQGLDAAGSELSDETTGFLLQQQCSAGYFRLYLPAATAEQQTCEQAASPASIDATAIAVRALLPQAGDLAVAPRIASALDWLESQQAEDGSLGSGDGEVANTNSTGLAGWAFGLAGRHAAAGSAADWVATLQGTAVDACEPNGLRDQVGAIAYDATALSAGRTDGITVAAQDQWRRASAQALPALQWTTTEQTIGEGSLSGPRGFVRGGEGIIGLTAQDLVAGEVACLRGPGAGSLLEGPGSFAFEILAPRRTGVRTYSLVRLGGEAETVQVSVLGDLTVPFTLAKARVAVGKRQVVEVDGLAPGERVKVKFRGAQVDSGHADRAGRFVSRFTVTGESGRATVKVVGQFADRTNRQGFQVR